MAEAFRRELIIIIERQRRPWSLAEFAHCCAFFYKGMGPTIGYCAAVHRSCTGGSAAVHAHYLFSSLR
jgi:hypothetical protein